MKKGDIINGYRILKNFTCAGGGLSKWTFAEKGGKQYFIKEFLHPTYPNESALGSAETKAKKKVQCEAFEAHHQGLMDAINSRSIPGGNLIFALDFFRWGAKYYKVTEKVDVATLKAREVAELPVRQRALIMTTVAHSLKILHELDIVHGDLKLENILIKKTRMGSYTTKLIDFDNSFFSGRPPAAHEVVGDLVFYSPELAKYIQEVPDFRATDLHIKSDVFALGLVYTLYFTGELPAYDREKHTYPWMAVNRGETLSISHPELPEDLEALINQMLHPEPDARPDIDEVFGAVRDLVAATTVKNPEPETVHTNPENTGSGFSSGNGNTSSGSKLKGTLLKKD